MFAGMYLNLLVRGLKIKACAYERSMRVFWHESEAHHWQADAFWDIALGVHLAHCAVQDQAWFLPFCVHHVEFARCNSFIPAPPVCADDPPIWRFLYPKGQTLCWALLPVAHAFCELVRQVGVLFERPRGNSDRAPAGTPSESDGRSLMSGSFDAEASARSSDSRYGWPLSGARLAGLLPRKPAALPLRTPGPTRVAQVCPS